MVGVASTSRVYAHLKILEEKGYICLLQTSLCCYVLCGLETGSYVFGLYPDQPALHGHYVLCWNEAHGPLLSVRTENEQHDH